MRVLDYSLFPMKWEFDKMGNLAKMGSKKLAGLFSIKREFDKTGRFSGIFYKFEVKQ